MNKPPLPTVVYRRSFVGLLVLGAGGLALTMPDILDSSARGRLLLVLPVAFVAALGLGVADTAPVGAMYSASAQRRRLSYVFGGVMAATLLGALTAIPDLPKGAAFGSWCGATALGMSISVGYRLLRGVRG